jgi:lysophospholipase L1-like esterase
MKRHRGLLHAHSAEEAHFDHFALPGIHRLQRVQGIVECHEILGGSGRHGNGLVERHLLSSSVALLITLRARGIHQNATHEARGHCKEMCAILPLDLLDFDQPEICLIDQRGRLKRVAGTLVAHMAPRQAAQFPMDEGQQAVERRYLTPAPSLQQSGGVVRVTANGAILHRRQAGQSIGSRPILNVLTLFDVVLASEGEDRHAPAIVHNVGRRQPMSSVTQFLSKLRGRATYGVEPAASIRIRRRSLATVGATVLALVTMVVAPAVIAKDRHDGGTWVGTWSASPQTVAAPIQINGQTVRQIVHTSLGGERVRVRFSNAYGASPLVIGSAHVAISTGGASISRGTDRILRFNGSPSIAIPAGALAVSDPVRLEVEAFDNLAVSLYLPENVPAATQHSVGLQTNYISAAGDFTGAITFAATTTQSFYFLTGVEVLASRRASAIVTLGDSVTEGFGSTPDMNQRWPNLLAERLQSNWGTSRVAVLNAGISGNRVLHDFLGTNALARFDRDVLVQTGVQYVIVLEGNADILIPGLTGNAAEVVTAAQIIQGHRQMIDRAHALGLRIYGGTLYPVEGYPFPGFWTPALETTRQAVNHWIRTSKAYDAVIDFDKVLRDPSQLSRLRPAYDSGDHAHPNDAGYKAMADAIDLSLFRDENED